MIDQYDFRAYLKRIEDLGYLEILRDAETTATSVDRASYSCKGAVERRKQGSVQVVRRLVLQRHEVTSNSKDAV